MDTINGPTSAARRVHDTPELLANILRFFYSARLLHEKARAFYLDTMEDAANEMPEEYFLSFKDMACRVCLASSACRTIMSRIRFSTVNTDTYYNILSSKEGHEALLGSIGELETDDVSFYQRRILEDVRKNCPNLQRIHTTSRDVNDSISVSFSQSGKHRIRWDHFALVRKAGRPVRIRWEPPAWRNWDVNASLNLRFEDLSTYDPTPHVDRFIRWFEDPSSGFPFFSTVDFRDRLPIPLMRKVVGVLSSHYRKQSSPRACSVLAVRGCVRDSTLNDFQQFIAAVGKDLVDLDLDSRGSEIAITDLPDILDLVVSSCPRLEKLTLDGLDRASTKEGRRQMVARPIDDPNHTKLSNLKISCGYLRLSVIHKLALCRHIAFSCQPTCKIDLSCEYDDLSDIVRYIQKQGPLTWAYIKGLDFNQLRLEEANDIRKVRFLPDGSLPDAATRKALSQVQAAHAVMDQIHALPRAWKETSTNLRNQVRKVGADLGPAEEHLRKVGIEVETIVWPPIPDPLELDVARELDAVKKKLKDAEAQIARLRGEAMTM